MAYLKYVVMANTTVVTPAANTAAIYAVNNGGKMLIHYEGPSGVESALQSNLGFNRFAIWNPPPNIITAPGTTVGVSGMALTTTGTLVARSPAATNMFTRSRRLGFTTGGTSNATAGGFSANGNYTIGTATTPPLGGFYFTTRFGDQDTTAAVRFFTGMSSSIIAQIAGEPSTFTNSIGIGYGTADTNYKIFYGGSAAQTPVDLGASFQCKTANTTLMELVLYSPSTSSNTVYYKVTVLNTGNTTSGTLTAGTIGTQLPANTTFLSPRITKNNVATGTSTGVDCIGMYIETDY
jgi:hypothetical protein